MRLSYSGDNYRAYSMLGFALGRTYIHSIVRDIMREAYAELAKSRPDLAEKLRAFRVEQAEKVKAAKLP